MDSKLRAILIDLTCTGTRPIDGGRTVPESTGAAGTAPSRLVRDSMKLALEKGGFSVALEDDPALLLKSFKPWGRPIADAIVFQLNPDLPNTEAYSIAKRIRTHSRAPLIGVYLCYEGEKISVPDGVFDKAAPRTAMGVLDAASQIRDFAIAWKTAREARRRSALPGRTQGAGAISQKTAIKIPR